jgi:hypothetical protein
VLRRASSSSYLLVLPGLPLVERLVGLRQPISSSEFNFSLLCKCWSRLSGAQGCVLPFLIDIELRGIPNHVWETSIVDRLLSPHAWVQQVHPDTLGLVDLSCFRCLAWSTDPSTLPSSRELWVVEPPTAVVEDPPVKRVLSYPVNIQYSLHPMTPNLPSDGDDDGEDDSARRRRRVRYPPPPPSSGPAGGVTTGHGGEQVHCSVLGMSHVAHSQAACLQLLATGSSEDVHAWDAPGDGHSDLVAVVHGSEDCPLPDVGAAANAAVSDVDAVACTLEELHVATPGPESGTHLELVAGLGCNSLMEALGHDEATVCCSPGQTAGPCSSEPPVGLATDGASAPASPRSPGLAAPESYQLTQDSSLPASGAGPASPPGEEPPCLSMGAPSCPVPPSAQPAPDEGVGLEPVPLHDATGDTPSSPVPLAALPLQAGGLKPDSLGGCLLPLLFGSIPGGGDVPRHPRLPSLGALP